MKKSLSIIVGLILLSPLAFAANDVTLDQSAIIKVGSYNLTLTGTFTVNSITVSASSFDVTLAPGTALKVASADRRSLTVSSASGVTTSTDCDSSNSTVTIKTDSASTATVTVTPSTTSTCSGGNGGGGSNNDSGSGPAGGGSGSNAHYNYGATPATPATPGVSPATPATPSSQALEHASATAQAVSPAFNKDLVVGNRSDDVKRLQQLLATDKSVYPEGLATGLYGPMTQKAVRAFQKKYGLPQVGRVGPATRAKLQQVFGK